MASKITVIEPDLISNQSINQSNDHLFHHNFDISIVIHFLVHIRRVNIIQECSIWLADSHLITFSCFLIVSILFHYGQIPYQSRAIRYHTISRDSDHDQPNNQLSARFNQADQQIKTVILLESTCSVSFNQFSSIAINRTLSSGFVHEQWLLDNAYINQLMYDHDIFRSFDWWNIQTFPTQSSIRYQYWSLAWFSPHNIASEFNIVSFTIISMNFNHWI